MPMLFVIVALVVICGAVIGVVANWVKPPECQRQGGF
jgi:hypothetical protein